VRAADPATLASATYRELAELLMSGQVVPGDRLSLRSLAEQLGVSPMPVREALRQLAAVGAVEIEPQRAARIPLMSRERFADLLQIRLRLEGLAAERAAARIKATELAEARRLSKRFEAEIRKPRPDRAALVRLNKELHFVVYRAAGSAELMALIEHLWLLIGPVVNYDLRQSAERLRSRPAIGHHEQWVQALSQRDAAAASAAVCADIASAADIIMASGQLGADPVAAGASAAR
jgi:DNA-binding GntR family transcriptional regulator